MQVRLGEDAQECAFCDIVSGKGESCKVFEDDISVAFMDKRPVFYGHIQIIPKEHFVTIYDLPDELTGRFFSNVKLVALGVQGATHSDGTFIAINTKVSQSVPHLHVHIVPRKFKDGMKGFFWPRCKYGSEEEMKSVQIAIKAEIEKLTKENKNDK